MRHKTHLWSQYNLSHSKHQILRYIQKAFLLITCGTKNFWKINSNCVGLIKISQIVLAWFLVPKRIQMHLLKSRLKKMANHILNSRWIQESFQFRQNGGFTLEVWLMLGGKGKESHTVVPQLMNWILLKILIAEFTSLFSLHCIPKIYKKGVLRICSFNQFLKFNVICFLKRCLSF